MHRNSYPVIYTVIVTYNGKQWIRKCLSQLLKSSLHVHIIVVDNASDDGTTDIIANEFSSVGLIKNDHNKGFGMANNTGMQLALQRHADYIFLLNQDVYMQSNVLEQMILLFDKNKAYGIISPVQFNGEGTALDNSFKNYLSRVLNNRIIHAIEQRENVNTNLVPVRFVNAAAWLIPADVVKKVGLFHPLFFHYGEDNNYCSRVQYHGYKTGIALNAYVFHDRAGTKNKQKELRRKIKTVIRYTATDLRKNFNVAYLLAWYKYFTLLKKARKNLHLYSDALNEEKQFLIHKSKLKEIRGQMKSSQNVES